jgi:hypothetical protein
MIIHALCQSVQQESQENAAKLQRGGGKAVGWASKG